MTPIGTITAHHRLRVRYGETDLMGIVYHANYMVWFHEARDALIRKLGLSPAEIEREGWGFPVVEATCRHHAPARYGDEVDIEATLKIQTVARIDIDYVVLRVGRRTRLADGSTRSMIVDRTGKTILRMPEKFMAAFHKALAADAAPAAASAGDRRALSTPRRQRREK